MMITSQDKDPKLSLLLFPGFDGNVLKLCFEFGLDLSEEFVVLSRLGKTAMDKDAYDRALPWMELDKTLFPGE